MIMYTVLLSVFISLIFLIISVMINYRMRKSFTDKKIKEIRDFTESLYRGD